MDIVMNRLVESWDNVKDMNDTTKATFISCLSPSHYDKLVSLRPEVANIKKGGK